MHVEGGNTVTLGRKPDPEVGVSVKCPFELPLESDPPTEQMSSPGGLRPGEALWVRTDS